MKSKKNVETFACLRVGAGGHDWVHRWLEELLVFGLPGPDYVLLRPSIAATGFTKAVADYGDVNACARLLLQTQGFTISRQRRL